MIPGSKYIDRENADVILVKINYGSQLQIVDDIIMKLPKMAR